MSPVTGQVEIFNSLGQLLEVKNVELLDQDPILINVEKFDAGIYVIQIKLGHQTGWRGKFMVD